MLRAASSPGGATRWLERDVSASHYNAYRNRVMWFLPVQTLAFNRGQRRVPSPGCRGEFTGTGWRPEREVKLYRLPFTIPTTLRIIHPGLTLPIVIPFGWKPAMFTVKCVHNRDMNTETQIAAPRSARVDSSKLLSLVQSTTIG